MAIELNLIHYSFKISHTFTKTFLRLHETFEYFKRKICLTLLVKMEWAFIESVKIRRGKKSGLY